MIAFEQGGHNFELKNVVINDTSLLTLCVYKVLLIYTLLSAWMAMHDPKKVYWKIFTYFLQAHIPLFCRDLTWEKKKGHW